MLRHRDEGSEAAEIREMGKLRGEPSRQCRALLLLVGPRVLRKTSPSPRSYGERVGVRGSLCKDGGSWIRGESPSPGLHLRCNPTSPRKRGEVKQDHRFLLPFPSRSSALRTFPNSASEALSARGKRRSSLSSAATITEPITTRANHLWSAGTTYHGAWDVAVWRTMS